jgi:hypothetical protein
MRFERDLRFKWDLKEIYMRFERDFQKMYLQLFVRFHKTTSAKRKPHLHRMWGGGGDSCDLKSPLMFEIQQIALIGWFKLPLTDIYLEICIISVSKSDLEVSTVFVFVHVFKMRPETLLRAKTTWVLQETLCSKRSVGWGGRGSITTALTTSF